MRPSRSKSVPTYQRQEMNLIETTLIDIFPARNMALLYPDNDPISWKGFLIFKRCRSAEPIENTVFPVPLVPNAHAAQRCRASLLRLGSRVRAPSLAPVFLNRPKRKYKAMQLFNKQSMTFVFLCRQTIIKPKPSLDRPD